MAVAKLTTLINRFKAIQTKIGGESYELAVVLKEIVDHEDYESFVADKGISKERYADELLTHSVCTSCELLGMLGMFPTKEQWEKEGIRAMREKYHRSLIPTGRKPKATTTDDKETTEKVTHYSKPYYKEMYEKAMGELQDQKAELAQLKSLLKEKDKEIARLMKLVGNKLGVE